MQILYLALGLAILSLSFMVVLNRPEQSSPIYAGSNVRFLAAMPHALLLLIVTAYLIPESLRTNWLNLVLIVFIVVVSIVYSAWMESRFKAGFFKQIMRAVVVDRHGKPISFKRACMRNLVKTLLLPLGPLNFYILMKDFRRQALHDKVCDTFVMWAPDMIKAKEPESSYEVNIDS